MEQETQRQYAERRNRLREAGLAFSISVVLMLAMSVLVMPVIAVIVGEGYAQSQVYLYAAYLLPQLSNCTVLLFYFKRSRRSPAHLYRGCRWYYFPIAVLLQFGLLFSLSAVNDLFISLFERFGYVAQDTPLPSMQGARLLPVLIVIALLPAVLEESLFRGILTREPYEAGRGSGAAILLSGLLFSLYHARAEQTVYQFVCGICFALLALRAGSILPSILGHFLNNALILVLTACGITEFSAPVYWSLFAAASVCLAGCVCFLFFFGRKKAHGQLIQEAGAFRSAAMLGILLCAALWVLNLVTGFVGG